MIICDKPYRIYTNRRSRRVEYRTVCDCGWETEFTPSKQGLDDQVDRHRYGTYWDTNGTSITPSLSAVSVVESG